MADDFETTWNNFQAAWSDIGRERRDTLIRENLAESCVYTDPTGVSTGYDELATRMDRTQAQYPGASFRGDTFTAHHQQAISTWTMRDGAGTPIFVGTSYTRCGADGRLTQMTGFFRPVE